MSGMAVDLNVIRDAVGRFPVVLFDTSSVYCNTRGMGSSGFGVKKTCELVEQCDHVREISDIVQNDSVVFVPRVVDEVNLMIRKVNYLYWEHRRTCGSDEVGSLLLTHKNYLQRFYAVARSKVVNFVEQKGYIPWLALQMKLHKEVLEETKAELPADPFLVAAAFHRSKDNDVCIISNDIDLSRLVAMTFMFVRIFEVQEGGVFLDHTIEVRGYLSGMRKYRVVANTSSGEQYGGWKHFRDFAHFKQVWLESYRLLKGMLGLRKAPSVSLAKEFYEGTL